MTKGGSWYQQEVYFANDRVFEVVSGLVVLELYVQAVLYPHLHLQHTARCLITDFPAAAKHPKAQWPMTICNCSNGLSQLLIALKG